MYGYSKNYVYSRNRDDYILETNTPIKQVNVADTVKADITTSS